MNRPTVRNRIPDKRKGRLSYKSASSPMREGCLASSFVLEARHQAKILFWFSLITSAMAATLQLSALAYTITRSGGDSQVASKLLINLSFNTVAIVVYRYAREVRRWATDLYNREQELSLVASIREERANDCTLILLAERIDCFDTSTDDLKASGENKILPDSER
jgi:hypothetical protein